MKSLPVHISTIAALLSVFGSGCSDDTKSNDAPQCSTGEFFDVVSSSCEPIRLTDESDAGEREVPVDDRDSGSPVEDAGDPSTACEGDESRCNANAVEVCVEGRFRVSISCGRGTVCEEGYCIPADGSGCEPGTPRCAGATSLEFCQGDRVSWSDERPCGVGEACEDGRCVDRCTGTFNRKSNMGCEYITMRHDRTEGEEVIPHTVVVSNPSDHPATVHIVRGDGAVSGMAGRTVGGLSSTVIDFPGAPTIDSPGLSSDVFLIQSSRPMIATQFAPLNNPGRGYETSDASLLLPTDALGKEYVVAGWRSRFDLEGTYVDIVAKEPNTVVTVESPIALWGGAAGNVAENSSTTFTLPQHRVLHLISRGGPDAGTHDVSGVVITASKPVAVFTGATLVNIPDEPIVADPSPYCSSQTAPCVSSTQCCSGICGWGGYDYRCRDGLLAGDHIEQQLFPVESWGTSYIATPFFSRGLNDFSLYRLVAAHDGTTVTLDPPVSGVASLTLDRGEYHQLYGAEAFEVTATHPVMLAQFMVGGAVTAGGLGDPAFLLPPAQQQYRNDYVFLVPFHYAYDYVTLIRRTGSEIKLDGVVVSEPFQPVGASIWEYAILTGVADGVHRAVSTEPFGVIVHGMDFYISYAFAGGMSLPE